MNNTSKAVEYDLRDLDRDIVRSRATHRTVIIETANTNNARGLYSRSQDTRAGNQQYYTTTNSNPSR